MLAENPTVVDYMRRSLLDPRPEHNRLLERLTELTRREVTDLRGPGAASTSRSEAEQVAAVMVRQVGHLFLQPMVDSMWAQLTGDNSPAAPPTLEVTPDSRGTREPGQKMIITCHGRSQDPRLLRNSPVTVGRILHDDEGALVGLAELMALDGPDLTAAQRKDIVGTIFSRI